MLAEDRPLLPAAIGLLVALGAAWSTVRLRRLQAPLRSGPWPGLTAAGAMLLLADAVLLTGTLVALGPGELDIRQRTPLPFLPLVSAGSVASLVLAARWLRMPGAATAVCGAYLLPRSLLSLLAPGVAPPALLLPAAVALDAALWLQPASIGRAVAAWGRSRADRLERSWSPAGRHARDFTARRAGLAGALFGLLLGALEPGNTVLMGGDAAAWSLGASAAGAALAAIAGACAGALVARQRSREATAPDRPLTHPPRHPER